MNLTIRLKATVSKTSSGSCGLPEAAIWMPVAPTVTALPEAPAIVQNQTPRPADSAPVPQDFDLENPDLCALFTSILSEPSEAVYANEITTESLVLPFNETVEFEALIRPKIQVFRFAYSLDPVTVNVSLIKRVRFYAARLYKFKGESFSLSLTAYDNLFKRTYILDSEAGQTLFTGQDAGFIPRVITAEVGAFSATGLDASIRVPGVFSYAWDSTLSSGTSEATPVNVWYRRSVHQLLYTYSILSANGMRPNALITQIRWYITNAVSATYKSTDFTVRMFHTTATNADGHLVPLSGTNKVTVFGPTNDTLFDSVGEVALVLSTAFEWDGVNSICIETCTSGNNSNYQSVGSMRISASTAATVRRYYRDDTTGASACDLTTDTSSTNYIAIKMPFV